MPYMEPEDFHAKKIVPCVYQEFPKIMYSPDGDRPVKAMDKKDEEKLKEKGWSTKLFPGHIINTDGTITVPVVVNKEASDSRKKAS